MTDSGVPQAADDQAARHAVAELATAVELLADALENALATVPDVGVDGLTALPRVRMHASQARDLVDPPTGDR